MIEAQGEGDPLDPGAPLDPIVRRLARPRAVNRGVLERVGKQNADADTGFIVVVVDQ